MSGCTPRCPGSPAGSRSVNGCAAGAADLQGGSAVDEDAVLPAHVVALFRELECVLGDARQRLDAVLHDAIPTQDTRTTSADPDFGGR